ncbi:proto-oncogene tyrosine-protein kinase ROS-like isoform X4 [Biomphalaria glabrata]|uniref:Tyrosine-protein kinase receptor n=1 Tax=Biomphalaria glabrata TaxID=6526 RepID=A0A9U8E2Z2_BIOGL|nr:proto-oncogene tyrosine-protein kinase ROS-like isoform X4 [Biomphalaria glabrata]
MAKYVFFLYTLLVSIVHIWTLGLYVEGIRDIDIVDVCHRSCETDLRYTSEGGSQLFCDQSCSVQQCNIGCQLYKEAVSSSCPKVCTSSFSRMLNTTGVTQAPSQDQMRNCIQGCIFALDKYSEEIRDKIGHLDQPLLDISTLNSSSLVLKWKTAVLESVVYKIQKKMVGMDSGWHLHDKVLFRADGRIELSSLHPYVTYKFKVLALLSSLPDHIMYSNETTEITTLPNGAPSTAPRITSLSAPSSRVISLTWLPPLFTNGKLLSYRIYVEPLNHPVLNATTIETPWNASSWLLSQLQSSLQYRISLSAWNAEGEGPKESRTIVTPSPGNLSEHETAYLILGSRNKVIKRNILDVIQHSMEYMDLVYRHDNSSILVRALNSLNQTEGSDTFTLTNGTVKDLCLHVSQEMIFASDSRGMVTRISLDTKQIRSNHYPGINNAGAITVDWLSDRVYVASADRIYSCPLDQDRCVVILNGLQPSPSDLKVDPINGFLYYVISGQGLYRIDLGDIQLVTSFQSQPYRPRSQLVIDMADLWTHIIDLYNVHLYVVNNTARRMMTTFLDGSNVRLFHENVIRSEYFNVTSMIFFNQTFIWTNTTKMFGEEQESPLKDYRHNELLFFEPPFTGINVFHPSTQPTPVPSSAPDEVEALFTRVRVDIRWKPPPLLQYQGKGAWINWTYELKLISLKNGQSNVYRVSGLKHTIRNLLPNSEYSLQVRAQSDAGEGPWSKLFIGKTLIDDNWSILLGVAGGQILRRNILEDQKKVVVNFFSNSTDIAWFENIAFWVTQEGQLTFYNQTSEEKRQLLKVEKAYSVAYDWLGKKVFWSDLSHVAIYRSDIIGIHVEFIRRSLARDLAIDALRGRLYWATQNSIETSYLNGEHHQELYVIPPFSGPNVISLTLDFDSEKVYWYVKASDSQSLYTTKLIPDNYVGHFPSMAEKVGDFKSISSTSGLQYFSQRLFWLSEKNSLMVGDLHCNFTATISSMTDIKSFVIVPSGLKYKSKPRVIPNPIRSSDIQTEGNSSKFNLTWSNSSEVTHGTVFYRVFIEIGNTNKSFTTSKNKIELSAYSPYIKIGVTIQPYTYWGYADPTTAYLRSPMSKPTAPLSPEVYVIEHKNATASYQTLAADFRWMSPIAINGIISHHFVYHWLGDDESSMTEVKVRGTTRNYILSPLIKNQTYHFKVVACTEAGCGPSSPNKSCVTNELNPVPKLLVGTTKGIGITETDSPYRDFTKLYPTIDEPLKAVSFLHQDDIRLYWINNRNAVVQAHENDLLEIFTLKGNGKDITVDWVSRTLYFVETFSSDKSSITQFNLDNGKYTVFLNRSANVQTIAVDPFNSAVLWLETSVDGEMQILSSDMTNKNVKTVLSSAISNTNKRDGFCNCTLLKNLVSVMAVTYSRIDGRIEIFFAENQTGSIYSTDINGCKCIKIFSKSMSNSYGFPPSLIAVDHLRVSWYSQSDRKLYSVNKATGEGLTMQDFTDITDIVALGSNLQPLPDAQCLDPGAASSNVQKYEEGVNYIYLNLTSPIKPSSCLTISSPQTKYTLYYRTVKATKPGAAPEDCQVDLSQCSKLESYSTYMELKGLQPYTQYLIQVAVSNHFYPYLSEALGHPLVITTKFGAPSAALEVVSEPCTPEKIMVTWRPSQVLNGPADQIFYRVQYSTVLTQKETENIKINRTDESYIQTFVNDLTPGTVYIIKVFSCMGNRAQCTSSETVTVKTFLTPYDVFFSNATSYSIVMSWRSPPDNSILRHQIIYAEVTSEPLKWFESGILSVTDNNTQYEELITQLQPNTLYSFKIKASYNYRPFDDAHYIWPSDDSKFTYRTLVFLPNEVSTPDIRKLKSGLFEVKWEKPNDNGAPITNYELELSSADPDHFNWHLVYNGSDTRWLIETKELKPGKHYVFRVAAVNSQGRGAFSQNSSTFIAPHPIAEAGIGQGIIGIIAGTVAVFIAVIFIIIVVLIIQKRKTKTPHFIIRGPDTELATLRELPHTAFQQSNTLYAISIKCTDEEIAKLPHFSRNQLMLTMFLGSGAFGEVFEGLAKNILGDGSGETRCAVKTLRKSASDHEKEEFLKEALLMKNFQHDNILRLLGVCLDNDPQFIIMELMEGGDLLSFLRSCRATSTSPAKLLLPDLVKICVHVVRGCKYLEDMHFVHRDLAARNCLVSSKFPSDMIVKIGDFGLARDIYKNDYYRKEGEGLLPVRWMSPESLVDGFFTTQSDIWAFGVLMWEVLTLGQQPYPARTNIEVLHFVRDGGKLERPEKCTDEMFSLMRKCWSFNCDHRPSFAVLLENLELFQEKCLHMSPEEIIRYSPAVSDGSERRCQPFDERGGRSHRGRGRGGKSSYAGSVYPRQTNLGFVHQKSTNNNRGWIRSFDAVREAKEAQRLAQFS